jgi:hypothetical protein
MPGRRFDAETIQALSRTFEGVPEHADHFRALMIIIHCYPCLRACCVLVADTVHDF